MAARIGLSAAQQHLRLSKNPLCAGTGNLSAGHLTWRYISRASPLSRAYSVRIEFQQGGTPEIFVDSPNLTELAKGKNLPHVFQQQPTQLCLCMTKKWEWSNDMWIDETYVPWTALWFEYFEEWLISGDWKGEGEHPSPEENERKARRLMQKAEKRLQRY